MTPDDERAMLDGFLAFYAEHPLDPAWGDAQRHMPGWLLDQRHAAVADTSALEFAALAAPNPRSVLFGRRGWHQI